MAAILITGANQGIGYHLTAALLRQGHQVAVLDWETHHLAALQNTFPTQLAYYPVDVRQGEALQAAVAAGTRTPFKPAADIPYPVLFQTYVIFHFLPLTASTSTC